MCMYMYMHTCMYMCCRQTLDHLYELISECNLFEQHVLTLQSLFSVHQLVAMLEGGREEGSLACVVSHTPPPPTFTYRLLSL